MKITTAAAPLLILLFLASACSDDPDDFNNAADVDAGSDVDAGDDVFEYVDRAPGPEHDGIYGFVNGCYAMEAGSPSNDSAYFLASTSDSFGFGADDEQSATPLVMRATDLGTYLFYDDEQNYLVFDDDGFSRHSEVLSDIFTLDDDYLPGVQFELEESVWDETRFQLRHLKSDQYLTTQGLSANPERAALVAFYPAQGCSEFPELSLDAEGQLDPPEFEDGSVYGIVETHSHIMSNFGFGGAGMFHGAPFHPLGVEHALPSCEMFHGEEGRSDLFGYGFDEGSELNEQDFLVALSEGETPEFNHHTEGYPEFTEWPNAHESSTHQTQYYKWIQRAYLGGLRLMVQHATTNQIICELLEGSDAQPTRYSCNDMVAADRILEETRKMERYIDAQEGGPGEGWFRIVESSSEAREVINDGKMAIILGLEVSNLFDCFLVPPEGHERCDEQDVLDALDHYYDEGVRAIFPVHKFDNAFSPGDGQRDIIELANFTQTGHWSNFTQEDCPDLPTIFDRGDVSFGGLNEPREDYLAEPPNDMSDFSLDPLDAIFPHLGSLLEGGLSGDYCQKAGMTELGEFLMEELMKRGIIIEIDHFPRRSYERAFEMLTEHDYPAVGTHGNHNRGDLYALGGVSKYNFARCADPNEPNTRANILRDRVELIESHGGFPAEGLGFDLNGFAGAPGPRFGENNVCGAVQENPVTYPITSYAGDVTFTQPWVGEREIDFNTEGFVHIGMLPELLQDIRNDGATDEDLEPLFKSAEGYLRMWEKSEQRAAEFAQQ